MAAPEPYIKGFLFLALTACLLILCAPGTPAADEDSRTSRPAGAAGSEAFGTSFDDAGGIIRIAFENGLTARIFTAEYLTRSMRVSSGKTVLFLDDGEELEVITAVQDPLIGNKGDGSFHPFDEDHVLKALGEIMYPALRVDIDIYILPFPRKELPASSTRGSEIFLSPDVRELSYEGAAFIVAHEVGHAFQNRYLPLRDTSRWSEYERLRAIEDERIFSSAAEHAYRPVEICAEDFRVLFGGEAARYDGRVENLELCSPECAAGLEEFFLSLADESAWPGAIVSLESAPNPFNPETGIQVYFNEQLAMNGGRMTVRIYDVSGALVRELYDGVMAGTPIQLSWDGRDSRGEEVASSPYFCVARAGEHRATMKLLRVK